LGTGFGVAVTLSPALAQPSPEPLRVAFSGPSECGANDRLLELSRELLGPDADHADVAVTAKVTAKVPSMGERRYKLRLELRGAVTGDRTLSGAHCDEALRAGAVVIALAINPNALATSPTAAGSGVTEPAPPAEVAPKPEQPPPIAEPPTSNPPTSKPPGAKPPAVVDPPDPLPARSDDHSRPTDTTSDTLMFGVFGRAAYGLAPAPRLGVKAVVGVVWRDVQLRVHGYFDPSTEHDDALAGTVRFTSLGGGADVCARVWSWLRLSTALCGGWSLTEVNASAPNVGSPTARDAFVSAGSLGVAVGVRLATRVSLLVEGGYSIPTSRPRFVVDAAGSESAPVFRVGPGPLMALGFQFGL
jgi:hypothetical protein